MVNVNGHDMNIICSGAGSPTVVLDAGLGNGADIWRLVQSKVSLHTRVCSYDRPGMGFSGPTNAPRDAAAVVTDLHILLHHAGIVAPYVLVGHSIAGLYTRLYTDRYPSEVAGLVQVDPTSEFGAAAMQAIAPNYRSAVLHRNQQLERCAFDVARDQCPFFPGLAKYHKQMQDAGCPQVAPWACAVAEVVGRSQMRSSFWKDEALEAEAIITSSYEVRNEQRFYGALPLIVLTDSEEGDIDSDGPFSRAEQRAMWIAGNKLDDKIAELSSVGAHFVVPGSTHMIQADKPRAVVSAIDEVVDQARSRSGSRTN